MSVTTRVGAAVAAGYVLGRFKKLRLAVVVASALSNSAVRERSLEMLKIGTQSLGGSSDVQKLGQQVSGKLVQAGKAAAVAAAAGQIDKLSDRLREQSTLWGASSSDEDTDEVPEDEEPVDEAQDEPDEEPEDEYDEEAEDAEEEPEDEYDEEAEEPEQEPEDEYDEEAEEPEEEPEDEYDETDQQDEDEEEKPRRGARSSRRRRAGAPTGGA
ncbi:hypothetical protein ABT304_00095 [Nocardioides sp. NPDC000445]|uniref:hypothetical protein n=1 Tax=Nocardioides sp. NPDC000445 TaxID=3154257 RepID=UPI00332A6ED1